MLGSKAEGPFLLAVFGNFAVRNGFSVNTDSRNVKVGQHTERCCIKLIYAFGNPAERNIFGFKFFLLRLVRKGKGAKRHQSHSRRCACNRKGKAVSRQRLRLRVGPLEVGERNNAVGIVNQDNRVLCFVCALSLELLIPDHKGGETSEHLMTAANRHRSGSRVVRVHAQKGTVGISRNNLHAELQTFRLNRSVGGHMEGDCLSLCKVKLVVRSGFKILIADTRVVKGGDAVNEYGSLCVLTFIKIINRVIESLCGNDVVTDFHILRNIFLILDIGFADNGHRVGLRSCRVINANRINIDLISVVACAGLVVIHVERPAVLRCNNNPVGSVSKVP